MQTLIRRVPELSLLIALTVAAFALIAMLAEAPEDAPISTDLAVGIIIGSFVFSLLIAIVGVIGGVGGGVIFTPVMLAFTTVDTMVIRATGLVVAMFSGLVSAGPFMRRGLADIRVVFYCAIPIIVGAMGGAFAAILLAERMGPAGDGLVRLLLGLILIGIAILFVVGGATREYPQPTRPDALSERLNLKGAYWEESVGGVVRYQVTRLVLGGLLFLVVGFIGGFFGLGGGWAVVPVLNFIMTVPLKVSAASSGVLLALGNAAAVWPYLTYGALIALFAAPWMLGQIIGGIMGAHILAHIKAALVRKILIVILFLTSIRLIGRGVEELFGIPVPFA